MSLVLRNDTNLIELLKMLSYKKYRYTKNISMPYSFKKLSEFECTSEEIELIVNHHILGFEPVKIKPNKKLLISLDVENYKGQIFKYTAYFNGLSINHKKILILLKTDDFPRPGYYNVPLDSVKKAELLFLEDKTVVNDFKELLNILLCVIVDNSKEFYLAHRMFYIALELYTSLKLEMTLLSYFLKDKTDFINVAYLYLDSIVSYPYYIENENEKKYNEYILKDLVKYLNISNRSMKLSLNSFIKKDIDGVRKISKFIYENASVSYKNEFVKEIEYYSNKNDVDINLY